MTRQMEGQHERAVAKNIRAGERLEARQAAKRDLLERQSERELNGAYEGRRSVASALAPSRSRVNSRKVQKGQPFGRILRSAIFNGLKFDLHATKGWRLA